ncbi:MAG: cell division/cell wall cluster transcriptional repressor MraZ [Candidatus Dormiibacterota bacterium]
MAFYGSYQHALDEKGRVAVPARFRDVLLGGVVTKGPGYSLVMYPAPYWQRLTDERNYSDIADADYRQYLFHLFGQSQLINWDAQGRILLTPQLREHAELTRDVVFVGLNQAVEVYSQEHYDERSQRLDPEAWERIRARAAEVLSPAVRPAPEVPA